MIIGNGDVVGNREGLAIRQEIQRAVRDLVSPVNRPTARPCAVMRHQRTRACVCQVIDLD